MPAACVLQCLVRAGAAANIPTCMWQALENKKAPPRAITASVLLVVAGCVVAGIGDFSFDLKGCVILDTHAAPHEAVRALYS